MCMSTPKVDAPDIPAPNLPAPPRVSAAKPLVKNKAAGFFLDQLRRQGKSAMTIDRSGINPQ